MRSYGQYCPVAVAAEVLGERWTILILRELLLGARRFAEIDRGLPGISRALLAKRLDALVREGLVEKLGRGGGYVLTPAGAALRGPIDALGDWGAHYSFGDPRRDQVRPDLLMWWIKRFVRRERLPDRRVVVRFDLRGVRAGSYWLLFDHGEVELCKEPPGFESEAVVSADSIALHRVVAGRITLAQAMRQGSISVDGDASAVRGLPRWIGLSPFAGAVREAAGDQGSVIA